MLGKMVSILMSSIRNQSVQWVDDDRSVFGSDFHHYIIYQWNENFAVISMNFQYVIGAGLYHSGHGSKFFSVDGPNRHSNEFKPVEFIFSLWREIPFVGLYQFSTEGFGLLNAIDALQSRQDRPSVYAKADQPE